MSQVCELTGTKPFYGNKVSHSNRKTRTRWNLNLKRKKFLIAELCQSLTVRVSTSALKTIDKKGGFVIAVLDAKMDELSPRLATLRRSIEKVRRG